MAEGGEDIQMEGFDPPVDDDYEPEPDEDFEKLAEFESTSGIELAESAPSSQYKISGERDAKIDAMASIQARGKSLAEIAADQWSFAEVEPDVHACGKNLLAFLDSDGFLSMTDEEMLERLKSEDKLGSAQRKYTHHVFQNEMLLLMANQVLRKKLYTVKDSPFFAIMADEYTDVANKEQLSFCVRWVNSKTFLAREEFLGFEIAKSLRCFQLAPGAVL